MPPHSHLIRKALPTILQISRTPPELAHLRPTLRPPAIAGYPTVICVAEDRGIPPPDRAPELSEREVVREFDDVSEEMLQTTNAMVWDNGSIVEIPFVLGLLQLFVKCGVLRRRTAVGHSCVLALEVAVDDTLEVVLVMVENGV